MVRAKPSELRQALEMASILVKAGQLFVPMPVLNAEDHKALLAQYDTRLDQLIAEAEKESPDE